MKVAIIEDEVNIAHELVRITSDLGEDPYITLTSVEDSLNWFRNNPMPDLILADIYLADGTCFEIFRQLEVTSPVVFCTSYDHHALEAFANNGIDYLLKPIVKEKLFASFKKFREIGRTFTNSHKGYKEQLNRAIHELSIQYRSSILVFEGNKVISVSVSDILFIKANGNNISLYTSKAEYRTNHTLDKVMPTLNPQDFFRANRQYVIHRKAILQMESIPLRKLLVTLSSCEKEEHIVISKERTSIFLNWLERGGL